MPRFDDSRMTQLVKIGRTYAISIDRSKSVEANCMSLVQEVTFSEEIKP